MNFKKYSGLLLFGCFLIQMLIPISIFSQTKNEEDTKNGFTLSKMDFGIGGTYINNNQKGQLNLKIDGQADMLYGKKGIHTSSIKLGLLASIFDDNTSSLRNAINLNGNINNALNFWNWGQIFNSLDYLSVKPLKMNESIMATTAFRFKVGNEKVNFNFGPGITLGKVGFLYSRKGDYLLDGRDNEPPKFASIDTMSHRWQPFFLSLPIEGKIKFGQLSIKLSTTPMYALDCLTGNCRKIQASNEEDIPLSIIHQGQKEKDFFISKDDYIIRGNATFEYKFPTNEPKKRSISLAFKVNYYYQNLPDQISVSIPNTFRTKDSPDPDKPRLTAYRENIRLLNSITTLITSELTLKISLTSK